MEKERIYKFDNAKFLLIAFVVIGHLIDHYKGYKNYELYETLRLFIYSFHMPSFIFISGLFYSRKNTLKKATRYIIIGFFIALLNFICYRLMGYGVSFRFINDAGVQWFMLSLATYQLFMYAAEKLNNKLLFVLSLAASLAVGYTAVIGDFFALTRSIVFLPFFILGTMTDKEKLVDFTEKKASKISGAAFFIGWGLFIHFNKNSVKTFSILFSGRNAYSKLKDYVEPYGILFRLLCIIIAFMMTAAVISIVPKKKVSPFSVFGSRTMQVYFWHTPVTYLFIRYGFAELLAHTVYGQITYILLGIMITTVLSLKPFEFPVKQITDLTDKIKKKS